MDEILQNLKKSYSENRKASSCAQKIKLYSNLATTQSFHRKCKLSKSLITGLEFLRQRIRESGQNGLQSLPFQDFESSEGSEGSDSSGRDSALPNSPSPRPGEKGNFPPEIYTSLLAIDIMGHEDLIQLSKSEEQMDCVVDVKPLLQFILPEFGGVSTFGLFKEVVNIDTGRIPQDHEGKQELLWPDEEPPHSLSLDESPSPCC